MDRLLQYSKVLKVTTLVTFGFRTLLLLLLSEARYYQGVVTFRLAKTYSTWALQKVKLQKM